MRKLLIIIIILLACHVYAEKDEIRELVKAGVKLHDKGDYNGAIAEYKKALEIDNDHPMVNYEIAMSYMYAKDFENAYKYSLKALKLDPKLKYAAYNVMGSALDGMGKTEESIKLYKKIIKEYPDDYLLHYNLALSSFNYKDYKQAGISAINAIKLKPVHSSSHILLAETMKKTGKHAQCILPLYYFLLLEPDTRRSVSALKLLEYQLQRGVSKGDDDKINIAVIPDDDESLNAVNLAISILAAADTTDKNKGKSESELFVEKTKSLFQILGELKKDNKTFWWDFYVDFYSAVAKAEHVETFCYIIRKSSKDKTIEEWLRKNNSTVRRFIDWVKIELNKK